MYIDSLTSTDVYVEKKSVLQIVGNKDINNQGILEIDSSGNELISHIDSGDTPLYRLTKYNGEDGILFYNPTTKHTKIVQLDGVIDVDIDFERGTKYYLGAKLLKSTSVNKNVFTVELNGLNVFKVFIEGQEITTYTISGNNITIIGAQRNILDIFSKLVVYAYKTTIITDDTMNFEIDYYQYDIVWDKDKFMSGEYFETIRGEEITLFDSLSINQSVTKTSYRGGFKKSTETKINSVDNVIDMNIFDMTLVMDMVQYVGRDEFRMILINPLSQRVVLVNNCKLDNGISLVYEKAKNSKKFNASCGNYIDIKLMTPSAYGMGKYGKGQYCSGTYVLNSHKVGD